MARKVTREVRLLASQEGERSRLAPFKTCLGLKSVLILSESTAIARSFLRLRRRSCDRSQSSLLQRIHDATPNSIETGLAKADIACQSPRRGEEWRSKLEWTKTSNNRHDEMAESMAVYTKPIQPNVNIPSHRIRGEVLQCRSLARSVTRMMQNCTASSNNYCTGVRCEVCLLVGLLIPARTICELAMMFSLQALFRS